MSEFEIAVLTAVRGYLEEHSLMTILTLPYAQCRIA